MGKFMKEALKWLLITIVVGFFVWFIGSIFRTIKHALGGS